jgi:hypothetical protein
MFCNVESKLIRGILLLILRAVFGRPIRVFCRIVAAYPYAARTPQ